LGPAEPPLKSSTVALWIAPVAFAGLGLLVIILARPPQYRGPKAKLHRAGRIKSDEAARLKQMMDGA